MPSFRETYRKIFLGTKATTANTNQTTGFITTAGLSTAVLPVNTGTASTTYGPGSYGLFDAKTWLSVTTASLGATHPNLILAAASVQTKDKISQFEGGYIESNKSKTINPTYVSSFEKYVPCTSRQHIQHVGSTKYTKTLSPTNGSCNFTFLCGEDYNLRVEIRNEPALRFLDRNLYRILTFNGGCCAEGAPLSAIDGTLAMIEFANQIVNDPELKYFINPIVYSEAGVPLYQPGTTGGVNTWNNYVSPGHVDGTFAGMRLAGAYVDTVFDNCSFEPTDFYEKVPVELITTMVDFNGDPCLFDGICVVTECGPFQGNGFGETVLRDLILSESYRQNKFPSDQRMREIELGSDILSSITRSSQYTRYSITHRVPRPNNPGGSYSEEQYTEEIIVNGTVATFETLMAAWLGNAGSTVTLQTYSCSTCVPLTP